MKRCPLDDRDVGVILSRTEGYAHAAIAEIRATARFYERPDRRAASRRQAVNTNSVEVTRPTAGAAKPAYRRARGNQVCVTTSSRELYAISRDSKSVV